MTKSAVAVPRDTQPAVVYRRLRELITRGKLPPGSPLIETDIATRLGLSRTPIRSALERLRSERLVVDSEQDRLFRYVVAPLTKADGEALHQIIAELDGLAAHDAALLPEADRRRLGTRLRAENGRLRARVGTAIDPAALYEIDHAFHQHYVDLGSSPRLRELYRSVEAHEERYARFYFVTVDSEAIAAFRREHDLIIRAIVNGDSEGARTAARTNWRNAALRLAAAIESLGERGSW